MTSSQQPAASSQQPSRSPQDSQSPARDPEGDEHSISYSRGSRNSIFISIPNRPIGTIGILTPFCLPAASCLPPAFPQLPCPLHGRIRLLKSHWRSTFLQRFYHPSGHPRLYDSRRRYVFPPRYNLSALLFSNSFPTLSQVYIIVPFRR